jgi:hypothetical protein
MKDYPEPADLGVFRVLFFTLIVELFLLMVVGVLWKKL